MTTQFMDDNGIKNYIIECGKRMLAEGLTVFNWGNLSVRGGEDRMFITPSGIDYDMIEPDDVCCMDLGGRLISGNKKPSIEAGLHRLIYKKRPDVNAILHTHPADSKVFACLGENIPLFMDEARQTFKSDVICAEYGLPGTEDLAEKCAAALGENDACLLREHGAVIACASMEEAFRKAHILEFMAQVYYRYRALKDLSR